MIDRYSVKCDRKYLCWMESASNVLSIDADPNKEDGFIVVLEFEGNDHDFNWYIGDYIYSHEKIKS